MGLWMAEWADNARKTDETEPPVSLLEALDHFWTKRELRKHAWLLNGPNKFL